MWQNYGEIVANVAELKNSKKMKRPFTLHIVFYSKNRLFQTIYSKRLASKKIFLRTIFFSADNDSPLWVAVPPTGSSFPPAGSSFPPAGSSFPPAGSSFPPTGSSPVSSIPVTNTKTKTPPFWRGFYFGVPGENRTHSPRFRKPMLYPVELRGQAKVFTAHAPRNKAAGHATRANRAGRRVPNNQPKRECFWRAKCRP